MQIRDTLQRPLRDLRISVTDRCNFRCAYCMPREVFGEGFKFLPRSELLTFEEIVRIARIFVGLGVEKVRLTGGEPLLRRSLSELVAALARIPDLRDLSLTTNGALLAQQAAVLREAGLQRVTVSLDSLDDGVFRTMNDTTIPLRAVMNGIAKAQDVGFSPVKINMVVRRGVNDRELVPMARHCRREGLVLRFIEFMDVGNTNRWRLDEVVSAREMVESVSEAFPLEAVEPNYLGEVASRYRYLDGGGEIGLIGSVTQPFCGDCSRARISSEGQLYTCLFSGKGHDLRALMRTGASDEKLAAFMRGVWAGRGDRYSEMRASTGAERVEKVEMSRIGG